jgi:nitric oxide reductase activation protein
MHTKDMLAAALREVGLEAMAEMAAAGYYHDFLSPLDLPEIQLAKDLKQAEINSRDAAQAQAINALRQRVIDGEFDANSEESDAWSESEEGQEALRSLLRK